MHSVLHSGVPLQAGCCLCTNLMGTHPMCTRPLIRSPPAPCPLNPSGSFEPACGTPRQNTKYSRGYLKEDGKPLVLKKVKSMAACCEACKNVVSPPCCVAAPGESDQSLNAWRGGDVLGCSARRGCAKGCGAGCMPWALMASCACASAPRPAGLLCVLGTCRARWR